MSTLEVHNNAVTKMKPSKNEQLIAIASSDGFIKTVNMNSLDVLMGEKKHNLPVTAIGFIDSNNFNSNESEVTPNHVVTGSADYLYHVIKLPQKSLLAGILGGIWSIVWHFLLLVAILFYFALYLPIN